MTTKTGPLVGIPISLTMLPLVDSNGRVNQYDIAKLTKEYIEDANLLLWQKRQYEQLQQQILGPKEDTGYAMMLPLQLNISSGATQMKDPLAPTNPKNVITIMVVNNHPFSRGVCHIRSSDTPGQTILRPSVPLASLGFGDSCSLNIHRDDCEDSAVCLATQTEWNITRGKRGDGSG